MTHPNVSTRPATDKDTSVARDVHRAAFRTVVEKQFGPWDDEQLSKFFSASWDHPGFQIVLWDVEPCGCCRIEDLEDAVVIHELALLPKFQARGMGSYLLDETASQAATRGVPVRLQVLKSNPASKLYERKGFTNIGETDTHRQMQW